jgi:hypothetical protein
VSLLVGQQHLSQPVVSCGIQVEALDSPRLALKDILEPELPPVRGTAHEDPFAIHFAETLVNPLANGPVGTTHPGS